MTFIVLNIRKHPVPDVHMLSHLLLAAFSSLIQSRTLLIAASLSFESDVSLHSCISLYHCGGFLLPLKLCSSKVFVNTQSALPEF